jgi:hypothetical protein
VHIFRHAGPFAIAILALALAGCATPGQIRGGEDGAATASLTPPIPADGEMTATYVPAPGVAAWEGTWYVSAVFPAASAKASVADPRLGAALAITTGEVSDVNGRRCATPSFSSDTAIQPAGALATGDTTVERLRVTCEGRDFALFLRMPQAARQQGSVPDTGGGSGTGRAAMTIFAQRPEALYLLEPADLVLYRLAAEPAAWAAPPVARAAPPVALAAPPVALAAPPVALAAPPPTILAGPAPLETVAQANAPEAAMEINAPAPVSEGPVAVTAPDSALLTAQADVTETSHLPASGTAIHLASYKGISAAKRGWKILIGQNDELDPLSPLFVSLKIAGKGDIIRLYATGADEGELRGICAALTARQLYCTLKP